MKDLSFPIFKTKLEGETRSFRLEDPVERRQYFDLKVGPEIEKLQSYLDKNTFVGFLLGKKNSGKGTYSKLFAEAVGEERVRHISVGDIVRNVDKEFADPAREGELVAFLKSRYRGFMPLREAVEAHKSRSTTVLLPTEMILALVEREINRHPRAAMFIDGFPRNLDQISYALYFRAIMGYRDDPDFFVFIDVPNAVIEERMHYRVVCPVCQTPRNTKLLRTKEIGYDAAREFYLKCDNPACEGFGVRMIAKEGQDLGIEGMRERFELDEQIMRTLVGLQGVPKVFLRNAIPVDKADESVDSYEITPSYRYRWNAASKKVEVIEEPWVIQDESGVPSYSLLPAAVVVSLIKQTAGALEL
jgi:adenylate kinase family enzyme